MKLITQPANKATKLYRIFLYFHFFDFHVNLGKKASIYNMLYIEEDTHKPIEARGGRRNWFNFDVKRKDLSVLS